MGSLDLPDEPDKPMRAMQADTGRADRDTQRSRELPDPDERGRAYEAARTHVSAETSAEASPGRQPDAGDQRSYWNEVPRFGDMWAKHEKHGRSKVEALRTDHSGDRPELPAMTAEAVGRIREAEPATLRRTCEAIERENKHGGWLEGFKHRLKDEDRIQEKITERRGRCAPTG